MSIQNEINRINTAKTNLATSIENKGVAVPAGTSLSNYSSLVDQINTSTNWGDIGGTLSNQTDLQDALNNKQNTLSTDGHLNISEDVISLDQGTIDLSQCDNTESQFTYVNGTNDGTNWSTITIGGTTKNIPQGGSGPDTYIKSASVSGSTLTLTKQDDTNVTFTDTDTTYSAGTNVSISASNVISATDTKYTAGTNIAINASNQISVSGTVANASYATSAGSATNSTNATNADKCGVVLWAGALTGGNSVSIDMSAYNYIEVYAMSWGIQMMYKIDLTTAYSWGGTQSAWQSTDTYRGGTVVMLFPSSSSNELHYSHGAVNSEKSAFYHRSIGYFKSFTAKTLKNGQATYIVTRIVGYKNR